MTRQVELIPQVGIVLEGKSIRLESTRAQVIEALGEPEATRWNSLYYFGSELRVDFDGEGFAEFIELLGGPEGALQPVMFGVEVFREDPEAVAALLKEKNGGDFIDAENGYSFTFRKLGVGLYRESVPGDVAEMAEEAEAEGCPMSEDEIEAETRRTHWATVGIGTEFYHM